MAPGPYWTNSPCVSGDNVTMETSLENMNEQKVNLCSDCKQMEEEILDLGQQLEEAKAAALSADQQLSLQKSRTQQLITAWKVRMDENTQNMKHFRQQKDTEMKAISSSLLLFESQLRREQKQIAQILFSKDKCIRQQRDVIKQLKKENETLKNTLESVQKNLDANDVISCDIGVIGSPGTRMRRIHGKARSKSSIEFGMHDHDRIINGHDRTLALRAGRKKMFRSKSLVENRLPQVSEEYEEESCDIESERKTNFKSETIKDVKPADSSQRTFRKGSYTQKLVRQECHIEEMDEIIYDTTENISKEPNLSGDEVKSGAKRREEWFGQSYSSDSTYQSSTNSTFTSPKSSLSDEFEQTESSDEMFDVNDQVKKIPQIQSVINQIETIDINDRKEFEERMPNEMWLNDVNMKRNPSLPLLYQEDVAKHNRYITPKDVKRKRKQYVRRTGSLPSLNTGKASDTIEWEDPFDSPENCLEGQDDNPILFMV